MCEVTPNLCSRRAENHSSVDFTASTELLDVDLSNVGLISGSGTSQHLVDI